MGAGAARRALELSANDLQVVVLPVWCGGGGLGACNKSVGLM